MTQLANQDASLPVLNTTQIGNADLDLHTPLFSKLVHEAFVNSLHRERNGSYDSAFKSIQAEEKQLHTQNIPLTSVTPAQTCGPKTNNSFFHPSQQHFLPPNGALKVTHRKNVINTVKLLTQDSLLFHDVLRAQVEGLNQGTNAWDCWRLFTMDTTSRL